MKAPWPDSVIINALPACIESCTFGMYRTNPLLQSCKCTKERLRAGDGVSPVDLDINLVQNLMASFEAQEGLPGPVGNLFAMMGLNLPHEGRDSLNE